ncbi:MAG: metal-dependent transcriptional regulator [Candidatus Hydrogenedens sp.]|nr:metal-dependent transcriptional regulator [Candidatus Hydrogenedentota bacterium]NLF59124.1 metal-dependent transcriptional regulator [Candidatus Hydrogenedens sp.]
MVDHAGREDTSAQDMDEANDSSHWREFSHNHLSHSRAHYLMAIDTLRSELGYARTTDVAEMLEVSRGAASMALAQLKKRGWVAEDPNRFLLLTDEGKQITELVSQNFAILSRFFEQVLGVSKEKSVSDACKMEHLMGLETGRRLLWLTDYLLGESGAAAQARKHMKEFKAGPASGLDLDSI